MHTLILETNKLSKGVSKKESGVTTKKYQKDDRASTPYFAKPGSFYQRGREREEWSERKKEVKENKGK